MELAKFTDDVVRGRALCAEWCATKKEWTRGTRQLRKQNHENDVY
jgi:hypothetical protein